MLIEIFLGILNLMHPSQSLRVHSSQPEKFNRIIWKYLAVRIGIGWYFSVNYPNIIIYTVVGTTMLHIIEPFCISVILNPFRCQSIDNNHKTIYNDSRLM